MAVRDDTSWKLWTTQSHQNSPDHAEQLPERATEGR